jgi:hypothetical protein
MTSIRWFLLFALLALPAHAADVVYPTGSRIGLVPPSGMSMSRNFSGFEDRDKRVAVVLVTLPADAYDEIKKSTTAEPLLKQGVKLESREDVSHPLGEAFLAIGQQQIENIQLRKWIFVVATGDLTALVTVQVPEAAQEAYPDGVIRAAVTSVSVRTSVPTDEQLSLLPFRVGELAGFKVGGVIAGRAVMLTDGAADGGTSKVDTHMVVAVAPGGPGQASERDRFANDVFASIPNLKDVRINSSEALRISGQQGHQIMARGRDGASGQEITIVQWLRFGGGAYLHLIGVARTDGWLEAYARFRQVRDGIEAR